MRWLARIPYYNYVTEVRNPEGEKRTIRITYSLATWEWRLFLGSSLVPLGFYNGDDIDVVKKEAELVLKQNGYLEI